MRITHPPGHVGHDLMSKIRHDNLGAAGHIAIAGLSHRTDTSATVAGHIRRDC